MTPNRKRPILGSNQRRVRHGKYFAKGCAILGCFILGCAILGCTILGCTILGGCGVPLSEDRERGSAVKETESIAKVEDPSQVLNSIVSTESDSEAISQGTVESTAPVNMVKITVEPGDELKTILEKTGLDVPQLLEACALCCGEYPVYQYAEDPEGRTYPAEGYIAPGTYEWEETASVSEVASLLLHSYDDLITSEMIEAGKERFGSFDNVIRLASIVQAEAAKNPSSENLQRVAAVFVNRLDSGMQLQSDVTIFYLQSGLMEGMDEDTFSPYYDTYIVDALPVGPIGSPSIEAIKAVLTPADTEDLFFVYDDAGQYYFAPDYETHLENCARIGLE